MGEAKDVSELGRSIFGQQFFSLNEVRSGLELDITEKQEENFKTLSKTSSVLEGWRKLGLSLAPLVPGKSIDDLVAILRRKRLPEVISVRDPFYVYLRNRQMSKIGWHLVAQKPIHGSFEKLNNEARPSVAELVYVLSLITLRKRGIERFCILCQDVIKIRGLSMKVCLIKESGKAPRISEWDPNQVHFGKFPILKA